MRSSAGAPELGHARNDNEGLAAARSAVSGSRLRCAVSPDRRAARVTHDLSQVTVRDIYLRLTPPVTERYPVTFIMPWERWKA